MLAVAWTDALEYLAAPGEAPTQTRARLQAVMTEPVRAPRAVFDRAGWGRGPTAVAAQRAMMALAGGAPRRKPRKPRSTP